MNEYHDGDNWYLIKGSSWRFLWGWLWRLGALCVAGVIAIVILQIAMLKINRTEIKKTNALCFLNVLIWATVTEISVKNGVWGPVEWLGDQLGGHPEPKSKNICTLFFQFFDLSEIRGDVTMRDGQTTEDRATQPMEAWGWVSQYCPFWQWRSIADDHISNDRNFTMIDLSN